MSACEKCWGESFMRARMTGRMQADVYPEVLAENEGKHDREPTDEQIIDSFGEFG